MKRAWRSSRIEEDTIGGIIRRALVCHLLSIHTNHKAHLEGR
jgi:hypothetical protein